MTLTLVFVPGFAKIGIWWRLDNLSGLMQVKPEAGSNSSQYYIICFAYPYDIIYIFPNCIYWTWGDDSIFSQHIYRQYGFAGQHNENVFTVSRHLLLTFLSYFPLGVLISSTVVFNPWQTPAMLARWSNVYYKSCYDAVGCCPMLLCSIFVWSWCDFSMQLSLRLLASSDADWPVLPNFCGALPISLPSSPLQSFIYRHTFWSHLAK